MRSTGKPVDDISEYLLLIAIEGGVEPYIVTRPSGYIMRSQGKT